MDKEPNILAFPIVVREFTKLNEYLQKLVPELDVRPVSKIARYEVTSEIIGVDNIRRIAVSGKLEDGSMVNLDRDDIEYVINQLNTYRNISRNFDFAVIKVLKDSTFTENEEGAEAYVYNIEISKKIV